MPEADAFNTTAEHPADIAAELQDGIGVLLHVAGSQSTIEPEEIGWIARKLSDAVQRLPRSLTHGRKEPQPRAKTTGSQGAAHQV